MNTIDPAMDPLYTFTNDETGLQSRVWARRDERYSVTLTDLVLGVTWLTISAIPALVDAVERARSIADISDIQKAA